MEVNTWRFDYSKRHEFSWLLASDMHLCNPDCDEDRIRRDLDEARARGARVLINGDVMDLILPSDPKRYTRGRDSIEADAAVNVTVDRAAAFLRPWADIIDMVGVGNHETAPLRFCSVDPVHFLLRDLAHERKAPIAHGGYTGFCRFAFHFGAAGRHHAFDIWYNHGQGGSSEVTKGAIDLSRRQYINADLIWLGHKHKRMVMDMDYEIGLTQNGNVYEKEKRGVVTGCYLKNYSMQDISSGYRLNYAEQRMRTPQARGGAWVEIKLPTSKSDPEVRITV